MTPKRTRRRYTARYVEAGLQGAPNTAKAYAGDLKRFGA